MMLEVSIIIIEKKTMVWKISWYKAVWVFAIVLASSAKAETDKEPVIVTIDRAVLYEVSKPIKTVIVGNPAIVDVTIEK